MAHYVIIMLAFLPIAFLPIAAGCVDGEWKCDNGNCIDASWISDGEDDCGDDSDERCAHPDYIGDDYCDDESNNADCNWDGGDCCGDDINKTYCDDCECHEADEDLASFEKRENRFCSNLGGYAQYDTLDKAKKACSSDWNCGYVYDKWCDGLLDFVFPDWTGPYYLCADSKGVSRDLDDERGQYAQANGGSCLYEKMDSDNFKCTSGVKPGLAEFRDYIDGNYIPKDWVCDGSADCEGDGEDEQGCGECTCLDDKREITYRAGTDFEEDTFCRVGAQATCSDIFKGVYSRGYSDVREGEYYSFRAAWNVDRDYDASLQYNNGDYDADYEYDWEYYFDAEYDPKDYGSRIVDTPEYKANPDFAR